MVAVSEEPKITMLNYVISKFKNKCRQTRKDRLIEKSQSLIYHHLDIGHFVRQQAQVELLLNELAAKEKKAFSRLLKPGGSFDLPKKRSAKSLPSSGDHSDEEHDKSS